MSDKTKDGESAGTPEERGTAGQLFYPLSSGAIDHWLVAGPHATPLNALAASVGMELSEHPMLPQERISSILRTARREFSSLPYQGPDSERPSPASNPSMSARQKAGLPDALAEIDSFTLGESKLTWRAYRCLDDHLIDVGAFYPTRHYVQAWTFAQLVCPASQQVEFIVKVGGAAAIWLNGQQLLQQEQCQGPHAITVDAPLQAGHNQILARLDTVARGDSPQRFGLSIASADSEGWSVCLPTRIAQMDRRQKFERFFEAAWLDRYVYTPQDNVEVYWPNESDRPRSTSSSDFEMRLQTPTGRIYMMALSPFPKDEDAIPVDMGTARRAPEGPCELQLMPGPEEYSLGGMRIRRNLRLHVSKNAFADQPAELGAYPQRRVEALLDATRRRGNLFSEIARMALEQWSQVKVGTIKQTVADLTQGAADNACHLVGLLGMLARFGENSSFPAELNRTLNEQVCGFPFWLVGKLCKETDQWGESQRILYFAAQILAGQLFAGRTFSDGQSGRWHRGEGERGAIGWLQRRGRYGFEEWDSSRTVEAKVVALIHLVDLAENDEAREMAAVLLDKIFLSMALNSYRGAFGSTQGAADSLSIRSARIAPSSGLSRLLWGMGIFNEHMMGSVSLACSDIYLLPPIIGAIAADLPEAMLNRERHSAAPPAEGDQEAAALEDSCIGPAMEYTSAKKRSNWEVNKVTYKTPDYMLCSAQDYRPGQPGTQEHIWQATFGADAVVFVNQPACLSESEAHRPNCWRGNTTLPRVAQWRDVLIAVHNFPDCDGVAGLTHAHFPVRAFDEYCLQGGWAFARKGDGYLALTAAQGLTMTERGEQAFRELRSFGQKNLWLCHLGRRAEDGDFADFQRRVLALRVEFTQFSVHCTTLRRETLSFGWTGPLRVNGREKAISGFRHYENPYCGVELGDSQLELVHGEDALRLHFV